MKSSIQNAQCLLSNMVVAHSWFRDCFTRREVGKLCVLDRIMDRFYYLDILEQNLLPSIDHFKFRQQSHFIHDNAPKHTSGLDQDWLKQKRI